MRWNFFRERKRKKIPWPLDIKWSSFRRSRSICYGIDFHLHVNPTLFENKMKFAAILVLLCICICNVHPLSTTWGDVSGKVLDKESVRINSTPDEVKTATVTYPVSVCVLKQQIPFQFEWDKTNETNVHMSSLFQNENSSKQDVTIKGIKVYDYKSNPTTATIVSGGVGSNSVTINIESQKGHGIKSVLVFYW